MRKRLLLDCIVVEFAKLRRSLALLLCVAAPVLVALLSAVMFNRRAGADMPWSLYLTGHSAMWGFFMLPMSATALTVLLAQTEHSPMFWNHLLALPVPRRSLLLAKLVVALLLIALMTLALALLAPAFGAIADALTPGRTLAGPLEWTAFATVLARMYASAWCLVAVQLWTALRWRSFVPPLVVGIGGTFIAVAATGSDLGPYFPWLMPLNALASDAHARTVALVAGIVGGLLCSGALLIDVERRLLR